MNIKPLKNNIFVRPITEEHESGLVVVGKDDAPRKGEIVFAADNLPVSIGDKILFGKWAGVSVKHNDEDLLVMSDMDVLVVF